MTPGARIQAAVEVLTDILERHRPVSEALSDWGKSHRFAGSGDRNAIGGVVYDALRQRSSIGWRFDSDSPRALAIGAASDALGIAPSALAEICTGSSHTPSPLSELEGCALTRSVDGAPPHVQADIPSWLWPAFERMFGARAIDEGRHLARRAPADLRVNTLKSDRDRVLKALAPFGARAAAWSPIGVRIPPSIGAARIPNVQAEAAFHAGWFEVQDEGSQIASLLTSASPGEQVLDLCAGGGGKTLALAALLKNTGQLYAYDDDRLRLQPIHERLRRAGARGVQVLRARDREALGALGPRFDLVLVDAPCTGAGVWRRRPDAKWRLKPESLDNRKAEQVAVLDAAQALVKPGGRLVYVTCSLLPDENIEQVHNFSVRWPEFAVEPWASAWTTSIGTMPPASADGASDGLLLTPGTHGTDGFFVGILRRRRS